ncbi:MAG: hypothetical protein WD157_01210 [Patescibacteria group bacterium]
MRRKNKSTAIVVADLRVSERALVRAGLLNAEGQKEVHELSQKFGYSASAIVRHVANGHSLHTINECLETWDDIRGMCPNATLGVVVRCYDRLGLTPNITAEGSHFPAFMAEVAELAVGISGRQAQFNNAMPLQAFIRRVDVHFNGNMLKALYQANNDPEKFVEKMRDRNTALTGTDPRHIVSIGKHAAAAIHAAKNDPRIKLEAKKTYIG